MQQFEQGVQHGREYRPRGSAAVLIGELNFGQFDVPVAELVPGEVVERLAGPAEFVVLERRVDLGTNLLESAENPAIGIGQLTVRRQRRGRCTVHQRIAGRVEQLGRKIARCTRVVLTDGQIPAGTCAARQGEPERVGAEHFDPVQRVDAVAP